MPPETDQTVQQSSELDTAPVLLTVGVVAALATAVMPVFLLGAVGVFVRQDLALSGFQFGAVLSAFNGGWLLTAVMGGRLADRLGGRRTAAIGVVASGAVLLVMAVATAWWQLMVMSVLAGFANALVQPGASTAVARGVPVSRHGLALGVKSINAPIAALLGGVAVPLVAVPFGWRWVFVGGAATVGLYFLLTPSPLRTETLLRGTRSRAVRDMRLYGLAVAGGAANAAATFLAGFFVEWQVAGGMSEGTAGVLFAVGSGAGAVARVAGGEVADRRASTGMQETVILLVTGAVALAMLSLRLPLTLDVLVTVVAFGAGWGWLGLVFLGVIRAAPEAPGDATGLLGVGLALGGLIGPGALGALADAAGLRTAWWAAAALLGVGAAVAAASAFLASGTPRNRTT